MKNRSPEKQLLDDIFADEMERTLPAVKRAARRRRWVRRSQVAVPVLLAIIVGCFLIRDGHKAKTSNAGIISATSAELEVASQPLSPGVLVRSTADSVVLVHTSNFSPLVVITERNAAEPEIIDDERLLEFAPGAILVRITTGSAGLVFPRPVEVSSQRPSGVE